MNFQLPLLTGFAASSNYLVRNLKFGLQVRIKLIVEISVWLGVIHPLGALVGIVRSIVNCVSEIKEKIMTALHEIVLFVATLLPAP